MKADEFQTNFQQYENLVYDWKTESKTLLMWKNFIKCLF